MVFCQLTNQRLVGVQVPQYILQRWPEAKLIVTQPRRIAATSIAARVASEMRCGPVGGIVRTDILSKDRA